MQASREEATADPRSTPPSRTAPPARALAHPCTPQLLGNLPADSSPEFFNPLILGDSWRAVAPFFQKALLLPAPTEKQVVSTSPLYTWEYDEIPWMEVRGLFRARNSAHGRLLRERGHALGVQM